MAEAGIIIVGLIFVLIGILQIIKPELYIKFVKWQMKLIWRVDMKYTKYTKKRVRIIGTLFLLIGLFVFYNYLILGRT